MVFKKGNGIKCMQDHMVWWYEEIPEDIDWVVKKDSFGSNFHLSAHGYGQSGDKRSYGNGSLFPYNLTDDQRKLLEKAVNEDE